MERCSEKVWECGGCPIVRVHLLIGIAWGGPGGGVIGMISQCDQAFPLLSCMMLLFEYMMLLFDRVHKIWLKTLLW
jgi:hypothetical protein